MTYDSESGELRCYAPHDEMVLSLIEPEFEKAHAISAAIQEAYRKGRILGRLELWNSIERHMAMMNTA